jgi:UDP-arabinose 4-epimerase
MSVSGEDGMPMSGAVVLVTGGAGYIGSHACKALAASGHRPIAFDNLVFGHRSAVRWGPLEVGDIRVRAHLEQALRRHRPDAVMHFAGFAYVGESVVDPAKYYENNVAGTLSLLDAMRACGVERIVFSSSCATYGIPERQPIDESAEQRPINPYGTSKLMVERMLFDYSSAYRMRCVVLRYFNACGADPEGEIGEDHQPETHLVPRGLMAATGMIPALELFGTDYDTPDGTCIRDFIHVSDLATGHVQALDYLFSGGESVALNLGTGRGVSVREVIAAIERVSGRTLAVKETARRPGDPAVLLADPSKARAILGFAPVFTDIDAMVATAWRWHQNLQREASDKALG